MALSLLFHIPDGKSRRSGYSGYDIATCGESQLLCKGSPTFIRQYHLSGRLSFLICDPSLRHLRHPSHCTQSSSGTVLSAEAPCEDKTAQQPARTLLETAQVCRASLAHHLFLVRSCAPTFGKGSYETTMSGRQCGNLIPVCTEPVSKCHLQQRIHMC